VYGEGLAVGVGEVAVGMFGEPDGIGVVLVDGFTIWGCWLRT
jgi:hypothetical protein